MATFHWFQREYWGPGRNGRGQNRRRQTRAIAHRRSFVPRFEPLEDRTLLSVFSVANLDDAGPGSLRQAILDAEADLNPDADVIQFAQRLKGTIKLSSPLTVNSSLTIDGPGAGWLAVSGGGNTRVFKISPDVEVLIDDLKIAEGLATAASGIALGGGILNTGASLTLDNVIVAGNQAKGLGEANAGGGGIANVEGGALAITDSRFLNNVVLADALAGSLSYSYGGAIYNDGGSTLTVDDCSFTANQAMEASPISAAAAAPSPTRAAARLRSSIVISPATWPRAPMEPLASAAAALAAAPSRT